MHPYREEAGGRLTSGGQSDQPAVFLDRDGVLVEDVGFLRRPGDLRILPGAVEALRSLAARFRLVVVTNQSGIARGYFSENDLLTIHQELARRLAGQGAAIDAYYYCPHLPGGGVLAYDVECQCRKPKPGMLLGASRDLGISLDRSYMVGDKPRDILAGSAAGTTGVIIGETADDCPAPVMVAGSLLEAAGIILNQLALTPEPGPPEPVRNDGRMSVEPVPAAAQRGELE